MPRKKRPIPWLALRGQTYYVFWNDEDGETKRVSLRCADSVEAQQRYAAFLQTGHAIFSAGAAGALGLTVSQALDYYKIEHVDTQVVDRRRQEDAIRHLKTFFADRPLHEIDIPASRAYADARRAGIVGGGKRRKNGEGSDSTIRRELVVLQAAANHALRWKRIERNDMPSIELPHEARRDAVWLTRDELNAAIVNAEKTLAAFIQVAYYTGARRHSIEWLRKSQIDLQHSRINLRSPNEDDAQRRSKKRRPTVPIDPRVRPVIERLMLDSPNEWLFGAPHSMYRRFRNHMESLGLGHKSNPHILRHSRATHLLQDGVAIYDVARLLGDTVATVDRVYGHHAAEHLAEAINRRTA